MERTLSIIKPDAVERDLENTIKYFFEANNLKISKSKKVKISKEEASEFYKVHQSKPFYDKLCDYLSSGPIVVMILEGENAVHKNRQLMGATDPLKAEEGSLRKLYGISIDKNSVHGSDSVSNAKMSVCGALMWENVLLKLLKSFVSVKLSRIGQKPSTGEKREKKHWF